MFAWKEKVAEKLSRLLADSPSSSSSPAAPADSQAITYSTEQHEHTSPNKSSVTSYVLSFLPRSNSGEEGNSPSHSIRQGPSESLPKRGRGNDLTYGDRPLQLSHESGTESEIDERSMISENKFPAFYRTANGSNPNEKPSTSQFEGYLHYLTEKSTFISWDLFEFFQSSLPNIVKGCRWILLYSTWKHGISLRTLLRRSTDLEGPCLLIVGDTKGAVFGGLLNSPLKPTEKRKYQGTNQTFVFTTIYGTPRLFRPTGANRFYYLCLNDTLAFGGGGSFALHLDEDLLHGTSGSCDTFGNACLAHSPEFELKNVELWGFTHSWNSPS